MMETLHRAFSRWKAEKIIMNYVTWITNLLVAFKIHLNKSKAFKLGQNKVWSLKNTTYFIVFFHTLHSRLIQIITTTCIWQIRRKTKNENQHKPKQFGADSELLKNIYINWLLQNIYSYVIISAIKVTNLSDLHWTIDKRNGLVITTWKTVCKQKHRQTF